MLITGITLIVFVRMLSADFVMWDDDWCIYNNPGLGGLNLESIRSIFTNATVSGSWYTPLTGLRWCITYHFSGLDPFGYHLGNWLLHGLNVALVFIVLRKLLVQWLCKQGQVAAGHLRITVSAALAALVWSLHPLQVEPVAWASAGGYSQSLSFLLFSLLCYLWAHESNTTTRRRRGLLIISVISFAASLLSQPVGLGLLIVLFVLDVYLFGRLGGRKGWWKSADARHALLEKLPFVVVALAVLVINATIQIYSPIGGHSPTSLAEFGLIKRLMQAMYIWAYYLWRPWYPVNLAPVYTTLVGFKPFSPPFIASGLVVVSVTTLLVLLRRRWPLGLALGVCHLALLVPVLGVFESPHYQSDRYCLIVSICWSVLIAVWLANPKIRRFSLSIILALSVMVVTTLGVLSFRQTRIWNNSVTLFEHMLQTLGNDPYRNDIHWRLGLVLAEQGDTPRAIEHFRRTLEIIPYHPKAHYHLARALSQEGKIDEAIPHLKWVTRFRPDWIEPANNLAWLLATHKESRFYNPEEAVRLAEQACELTEYKNLSLLNTLSVAYAAAGKFPEAIATTEKALELAKFLGQSEMMKALKEQLRLYILHKRGALKTNALPEASSD